MSERETALEQLTQSNQECEPKVINHFILQKRFLMQNSQIFQCCKLSRQSDSWLESQHSESSGSRMASSWRPALATQQYAVSIFIITIMINNNKLTCFLYLCSLVSFSFLNYDKLSLGSQGWPELNNPSALSLHVEYR